MTEPHTFMPGEDDPLAGIAPNPASAAPLEPAAAVAPMYPDPVRDAPQPTSVFEQVHGRGISNHLNHLGVYSMFFGIVGVLATTVLYVAGGGVWWLNAGLGGVGAYYGWRGVNASRNRLATNGRLAMTGGILGLLALVGSLAWLVIVGLFISATARAVWGA